MKIQYGTHTSRFKVFAALLLLLACGAELVGAGGKKKKKKPSASAARKCALCDWLVGHLQRRAGTLALSHCYHNLALKYIPPT
eukprot:COSAG02_NODE_22135_length_762_cov_1.134238_2_plen_83_part_00